MPDTPKMLQFLCLPPEILHNIIGSVRHPDDVDAFCGTSRHIRAVAGPIFERHKALKREYTTQFCGGNSEQRLSKLLIATVENPRIAHYVGTLEIDGWSRHWRGSHKPIPSAITDHVMETVGMEYLTGPWPRQMTKPSGGSEDAILIYLVLTLPNL